MNIQSLSTLLNESNLTGMVHAFAFATCILLSALAALMAGCCAVRHVLAESARFGAWAGRTPKTTVAAVLIALAVATHSGGSKPQSGSPFLPSRQQVSLVRSLPQNPSLPEGCAMPPPPEGFNPPARHTNTFTQAQYDACFALTSVTNLPHDFGEPSGAEVSEHVSGHGIHDEACWIPLPSGFNAGGLEDRSRAVTAVCAVPSGMIVLDGPPDRLAPSAPVFAGDVTNRLLSVLQTPSGLLPPEGRLWSAAETGGQHLVTWRGLMLGRIAEAKADLQCRLSPDGDFDYFIRPLPDADLSAVTNWLIAAQDAGGGETRAFATNAPLSAAVPDNGETLALRWTAFGRLDPAVPDTDSDGLTDWEELFVHRTALRNRDSDNDGLEDGEEVLKYGTDPLKPDSLEDGTNDFWRVVDPATLTNAPWTEGGEGLALLTLETRLDADGGVAALRVGDALVPILPGTSRTSRVAIPRGVDVPFALIPGPGTDAGAASVTAVEASPLVVAYDDADAFLIPAGSGAWAAAAAGFQPLSATPASGVKRGVLHGVNYEFYALPLCPHTGNGTLHVRCVGSLPPHVSAFGFTDGSALSPSFGVSEQKLADDNPALAGVPGAQLADVRVTLGVAFSGTAKALGSGADTAPAHLCVLSAGTGGGKDVPTEGECLCCPGETCPCRCDPPSACACAVCRDSYYADAPINSAGQALGTADRPDTLLLAGGAPDEVRAGPAKANGLSPLDDACALCGCPWTGGDGGESRAAVIYRRTSNLSAVPAEGFAATSGVFTVTGTAPGDTVWEDVFTWKAGLYCSRGRYTVVGLGIGFPNAVPGAAPRVQTGHTNVLLVTTQLPTNSAGTVSFSDHTFVADVTVKNRQTGLYEALQGSYGAAGWLENYVAADTRSAELRYAATAAGSRTFTVTYTQPGAAPSSVSTNLAFEAVRLLAEPVTAASDPATGFVYNPSGMPLGGTDRFRIEVAEGSVPNGEITWTVKSGAACVSLAGGNTGPEVALHADAVGAFTLEADVRGLVVTSPNVRPFFSGEVLQTKTVPATVWVVRDTDGHTPADSTRIAAIIADANKLLRQAAITISWNGTVSHTNRNDWYTLELPADNVVTNGSTIWQMMSCANGTGGIEFYFVDNMVAQGGGGPPTHGFNVRGLGLALGDQATGHTLAHEVLHECGLADIYNSAGGLSVSGPVAPTRMGGADWGGGYYPAGLLQEDFNQGSLLMYGDGDPEGITSFDLPWGGIYGVGNNVLPLTGYFLGLVSVGRGGMEAGEPAH